jgi:hypothetical protein
MPHSADGRQFLITYRSRTLPESSAMLSSCSSYPLRSSASDGLVAGSTPEATASLWEEGCSPKLGTGPGCSPWASRAPVAVSPPALRSVVSFGERLERFARRRASEPSLCLATEAGVAGHLNGRTELPGSVDESAPEGRVSARRPSWHGLGSARYGSGQSAWRLPPILYHC